MEVSQTETCYELQSSSSERKNEKYSLRQRRKRALEPVISKKRSGAITKNHDHYHKYRMRSNSLEEVDKNIGNYSPQSSDEILVKLEKEKPKTRAPPLSKYRRKTANARERTRMQEINSAFENLRKCVPISLNLDDNQKSPGSGSVICKQSHPISPTNEKLTKITTLRLAMKYIRILSGSLEDSLIFDHLSIPAVDLNNNNHEIITDNDTKNLNNLLNIEVPPTSYTNNLKDTSNYLLTTTTLPKEKKKVLNSKKKRKIKTIDQNLHEFQFGSTCLTPPLEDSSSNELHTIFESSDIDSHYLFEHCLINQTDKISYKNENTFTEQRVSLESDSDSLHLSEPCLSPFDTLLTTYNDFLNSNFADQTILDFLNEPKLQLNY